MMKRIVGAVVAALVVGGGGIASAQETPPADPAHAADSATASPAGTNVPRMQKIHEDCVPQVIEHYNDPENYATEVPPSEQGKQQAAATNAGVELNTRLTNILNRFLKTDMNPVQVRFINPWEFAATPVGDANNTEWGLLVGEYGSCVFALTKLPQEVLDQYNNSDSGEATWTGFGMSWGTNADNKFEVSVYPTRQVAGATTTTSQPAPTTTNTVAPTTTNTVAPTTTNTVAPTETAAPVDLPPAPAPTIAVPTGGPVTPDMGVQAQQCYDGLMQACDDLYTSTQDAQGNPIDGLEAYSDFADSCAGRQAMGTGTWCANRFASTNEAAPVPDGTAAPAPAPTTTSQPAPVNQPASAIQAAHQTCVPIAVRDWFANRDKNVHPASAGGFQTAANEDGVSLNDYVNRLVSGRYESGGGTVKMFGIYERVEEGSDLFSEFGLLMGTYLECLIDTLPIPDSAIGEVQAPESGSSTFNGVTMTWGMEKLSEDDTNEVFVIRLTAAGA